MHEEDRKSLSKWNEVLLSLWIHDQFFLTFGKHLAAFAFPIIELQHRIELIIELIIELQHLLFTSDPRPNQDPNHCLFFGTSAPSQHWFRDETRRVHAHSPLDFAPWMPFSKDTPHQLGPLNPSAGCLGQFCNSWTTATHLLFPHSLLDPHWRHLHQILL